MRNFWLRCAVALVFCLTLFCGICAVQAEDCFTLDVDTLDMDSLNSDEYVACYLSAQTQGICVRKYISDSGELVAHVRLTLTQMETGDTLFDKDYGYQSGIFDSGVIYLPYVDNCTIPYLVTLYVEDVVYAMPFMHLRPRLAYNGACTYGVRLQDLNPGFSADWMMGTMVDLNALRAMGSQSIDLCASNAYVIGQATISMNGDALCVQLAFLSNANVEVNHLALYVITDCASMTTADVTRMTQPAYNVGDWVEVGGAASALIYLPMQVSYDAAALSGFGYDLSSGDLQAQLILWQENCGGMTPGGEWSDDGSMPDQGDGWDENSGWVDDGSGWVDDGSGWVDDGSWDDGALDNSGWTNGGADDGWDSAPADW
ncbi:MAG: hypothetical protein RSC91_08320 [Clostridia bacterium]